MDVTDECVGFRKEISRWW